ELLAGLYDASLDALKPHAWHWNTLSPIRWLGLYWTTDQTFGTNAGTLWLDNLNGQPPAGYEKRYDELLNYPLLRHQTYYADSGIRIKGANRLASASVPAMEADASVVEEVAVVGYGEQNEMAKKSTGQQEPPTTPNEIIPVRANLQETAFFFPQLQTDAEGNVTFNFTMPEALTEWKLMAFAHTPDWKTGLLEGRITTQKDLMVMPNLPRFLRQGDDIRISAKVSNISAEALHGTAHIELLDATTGQPLTALNNKLKDQTFSVTGQQSTDVAWVLSVPDSLFDAIAV